MNHPHEASLQNNLASDQQWQQSSAGIAAKPKEKLLKFIYIDITRLGGRGRQTVNICTPTYTHTNTEL